MEHSLKRKATRTTESLNGFDRCRFDHGRFDHGCFDRWRFDHCCSDDDCSIMEDCVSDVNTAKTGDWSGWRPIAG